MSGSGLSEDFPPNIQAVLAVTEEGNGLSSVSAYETDWAG